MAQGTLTKGTQVFVSTTAAPDDLTQTGFEALEWELVCCPTTAPSFGQEAEIVSEFCISGEEVTAVGAASGLETEIGVFYQADCEGQDILREAFEGFPRAFKKVYPDSPNPATTTGTTIYTRALVTTNPDGEGDVNEFITHTFGLKIVQPPILVKPEAL